MNDYADVISEFLVESREGLDQVEHDLVMLEETPDDGEILARVFRCFHTIKGTAGFLGYPKLESLAHAAESLLGLLRDGVRTFSGDIAGSLLETVDSLRAMLGDVATHGNDGERDIEPLANALRLLAQGDVPVERGPAPQAVAVQEPEPDPDKALQLEDDPPPPEEDTARDVAAAEEEPSAPAQPAAPGRAAGPGRDAAEGARGGPPDGSRSAVESVRVDVALLDKLMDLAGELVLIRNHITQLTKRREDPALNLASQRLSLITGQMQHEVMRMRMQPVANLFSKLPRLVRDLARICDKRVRLEVDARNTELDKSLIEAIKDPMTHLLRNCVDHGIETPEARVARGKHPEGRILVRAFHQNGLVHIEVSDDGAGIALEKVRTRAIARGLFPQETIDAMNDSEVAALIFLPGFSTAAEVTKVSGRGVGMDVVKHNVEQIGGTVEVESRAGRGSTFTLKVPLTLAIVPALILRCNAERYAIPQVNVVEVLRLSTIRGESSVEWFHGAPVFRLRGKLLPLIFLQETLGLGRPNSDSHADDAEAAALHMAVLHAGGRLFGLVVDAVIDQQEIVAKPLPPQLRTVHAFSGATLLGDGRVALILDALAIAQRARVTELRDDSFGGRAAVDDALEDGLRTLLLFRGSDDERFAVPMESLSRLETFERNAVESAGPQEVVQYRSGLLPIFAIEDLLPERRSRLRNPRNARSEPSKSIDIMVLADGARSIGLVVDDVLDVVETGQGMRRQGCRDGVIATVVLHGRVTEVLDVRWVIQAALGAAEHVEELML